MSYLVDALRKAEHERRQGTAPETAALSGGNPGPYAPGPGAGGWVVAGLVVCNVVLFGYLFWPGAVQRQSPAAMQATPAPGNGPHAATQTGPQGAAPVKAVAEGSPARMTTAAAGSASTRTTGHDQPTRARTGSRSARRRTVPVGTQPPAGEVPDVDIHGHLYSGNPAASFILVNGRIYHEGERLPSGVTVLRIDREGALLNYYGRRFHVDAPG